ncbi:GNAT family N-acetyltransferase [Microbacterium sp. NPDC019599]|uniref:GNAT family N-acetyltransferase n=1 Tax=Microbacterium sp. NPDC019599 TaxID=3154690 RepID=UPI0033C07FA6
MLIRAARLDDLPAVYRICHETGLPQDGSARSPELLGHVYVGPYLVAPGARAVVVVDDEGVGGYLLCARDTRAHEAWVEQHWLPGLRADHPLDIPRSPADQEVVELLHTPDIAPDSVVADFPAHLHIDLFGRLQGQGLGRSLIDELITVLTEEGIPGIHLGVGLDNAGAIRFYGRLGFVELTRSASTVYMGRRL